MKVLIIIALVVLMDTAIGQAAIGLVAEKVPALSASRANSLREARKQETPKRTVLNAQKYFKPSCSIISYLRVWRKLRRIARTSEQDRWAARFLRLGFHDCLPRSCDGSIKFETERIENRGLGVALEAVETAIQGTCVGLGDGIKIAIMLSMQLSRGPRVFCPIGNIVDATEANPDDRLPGPFDPFADIVADFDSMGFTLVETLAGNYGGHALGRFRTRAPDGMALIDNEFTPNPDRFSNSFAKFVADGAPPSQVGFNALPSDNTLFNNAATAPIVERFATNRFFLRSKFRVFLSKMCSV